MHTPRRRRTLPLAVLAFTLLTTVTAVVVRQSLACPIEIPPQPLRTLYKHSDRIVVARVGHTELIERTEDYSYVRTALHVARNVKGKDEGPVVFVYHETWVEDGVEKPGTYQQGDQLLVFLERRGDEEDEGGGGYQVDNADFGVKKLSDDALKVYLARIDELEKIEGRNPPDKTALVEWLVRCAEEPATRWEGAHELMLSAEALARVNEQKDRPAEAVVAELSIDKHGATVEEYEAAVARVRAIEESAASPAPGARQLAAPVLTPADSVAVEGVAPSPPAAEDAALMRQTIEGQPVYMRKATPLDPSLAAALGEDQKRRLADALFGAEKMGEGEDALLHVVKGFGDARLVPFLVAQLRRVEEDAPPEVEAWLTVLSHVMNNEEALGLVMKYAENVTYYEGEETADDATAEIDEATAQKEMEAREAAANERARKTRSAMLKDLLARVERIIASPQLARQ